MRLRSLARDLACLARTGRLKPSALIGVLAEDELVLLVKRLDRLAPVRADSVVRVEEVDAAALPALDRFNRARCASRATARFAADLAAGRRGFVVRVGDGVAGYYWWVDAATGHPHLERLGIRLGPRDVYGYDFFIAEEHRGGGRAGAALLGVETALAARGYECVWGYVRRDNRPARWLYRTRGYEERANVHVRRFRITRGTS
jgi:ribosomal protein S18 acetylase RimI-like enzyme